MMNGKVLDHSGNHRVPAWISSGCRRISHQDGWVFGLGEVHDELVYETQRGAAPLTFCEAALDALSEHFHGHHSHNITWTR